MCGGSGWPGGCWRGGVDERWDGEVGELWLGVDAMFDPTRVGFVRFASTGMQGSLLHPSTSTPMQNLRPLSSSAASIAVILAVPLHSLAIVHAASHLMSGGWILRVWISQSSLSGMLLRFSLMWAFNEPVADSLLSPATGLLSGDNNRGSDIERVLANLGPTGGAIPSNAVRWIDHVWELGIVWG